MRYSTLHRRCAALVHRLDRDIGGIPRPFDLDELLDRIERHRERPIDLHATRISGGPCGLWLRRDDADVIVYPENTSTVHQTHIVLHEIGHMVCEHRGACALDLGSVGGLVSPERALLAEHMLARSTYGTDDEQEAEMVGTLIRLAAETPSAELVDGRVGGDESGLYRRIADLFG
ncbi:MULTISPECIES: hypothetical protein [unclassified Pseudonocardia]|uniref:hypothetical protein n=1 Tax=unclassified Pseudonocardia TaxID=2619320 RepID=UPI000761634A|nr:MULTISPECIES: hypothetical protein [unclassified Pseudonocardia]